MKLDKSTSVFEFGIFGGILGGLIAFVGFLILSPDVDSLLLFILLRTGVGAVAAMLVGPSILALKK